jgi:predicted NBD/HSP70 family sugar kinase
VRLVGEAAQAFAQVLAVLVKTLDPDLVVVSGVSAATLRFSNAWQPPHGRSSRTPFARWRSWALLSALTVG